MEVSRSDSEEQGAEILDELGHHLVRSHVLINHTSFFRFWRINFSIHVLPI